MKHSCAPLAVTTMLFLVVACNYQQRPGPASLDARAADERAIRNLSAEWSKVAGARDLEKTLSYYADDASTLPPNAPIATGSDARRQVWSNLMAAPGYGLSFDTTKVEVARSGDLAYEMGTYQLTVNDKTGKPTTSKGKYVVVWRKQPGGAWKAVADIFNADQ